MRVLGIVALVSVAGSFAAVGQTPYDGIWHVTVLTKAGSCEPTTQYAVTVADGKISGPQNVSGVVGREGRVKVSIGSAYANGQLDITSGAGKWNGASGGIPCSGRWEASRR
jgi:hypothetical protein